MSQKTKIAWADSTWNPWRGCTKVSDGCKNCYAETLVTNRLGGQWGKGKPRTLASESIWHDPVKWNKKPWICNDCGTAHDAECNAATCPCSIGQHEYHRRRIFSLSLGDWLDPEVPIEWLTRMLDTIRLCDQVTWILCTKRPELWAERMKLVNEWVFSHAEKDIHGVMKHEHNARLLAWLDEWLFHDNAPKNIILLASVENQAMADQRIPELLKIPAACRGLSLEPLLGPVDLNQETYCTLPSPALRSTWLEQINWLIIGGESGHGARPCNVEWIRSLVKQGKSASVATFVKQLGADARHNTEGEEYPQNVTETGKNKVFIENAPLYLKHPKGGDPSEWPKDLQVQQWPEGF